MTTLSYAIVTPTFRLDLERCALLVDSVQEWVAPHVRHYLVIDRRDVEIFRPILTARTHYLVVEDIVPKWVFRLPFARRFWFSLRTRPLKNWILQQLVKLSIAQHVKDDVLLCTDSDVFFNAPYDPRSFEVDGKVPLFVEYGQRGLIRNNDEWHRTAARLLGLESEDLYDTNFIGNIIPWRRENVLALTQHMEQLTGRSLSMSLAGLSAFSEYILYGLFATRVLGKANGHWEDTAIRTLNHWEPKPLSIPGLEALKRTQTPEQFSVMISAKSGTPVQAISKVFRERAVRISPR